MSEKMVRVTFSIPKELKERTKKWPDLNWQMVFKEGLRKMLEKLESLKVRGEL